MLPAFFALVKPVSSIAKPACIKNIKAVQRRTMVRTKAQFKLLQSVEEHTPEMQEFIASCIR